jgi:hypothetical protein
MAEGFGDRRIDEVVREYTESLNGGDRGAKGP